MSAAEKSPRRIVQAIPANGDVIHAVFAATDSSGWRYPGHHDRDPRSHTGRLLGGRALCGVRGTDAMSFGGMLAVLAESGDMVDFDTENIPEPKSAWNGDVINVVCPRCIPKARRIRKNGGA